MEYNNFEAGEGKSKLDTHFAHISHKIVRWVRVGNNLETGSQLGDLIGVCIKNVHHDKVNLSLQLLTCNDYIASCKVSLIHFFPPKSSKT